MMKGVMDEEINKTTNGVSPSFWVDRTYAEVIAKAGFLSCLQR